MVAIEFWLKTDVGIRDDPHHESIGNRKHRGRELIGLAERILFAPQCAETIVQSRSMRKPHRILQIRMAAER